MSSELVSQKVDESMTSREKDHSFNDQEKYGQGVDSPSLGREFLGTDNDIHDMARIGRLQQFRRNFHFIPILGFSCVLMATWEATLTVSTFGLINGGLAGSIWVYLGTFIGFFMVVLSMAEMASMAPTTGGQYHWTSEFAPKNSQKFLSYISGWSCALGWQSGTASIAYIGGTLIQGLLVVNYPTSYEFHQWHGTLLIIAISSAATLANTYGARRLPLLEYFILVLHVGGFIAIMTVLWVKTPSKNSKSDVFRTFINGGEWSSIGLACLVGQISPIFGFIGPDAATHMAEEIQDASLIVPWCMTWTAIVNGLSGFVMLITLCFCLVDLETALGSPTGYPAIEVFINATGPRGASAIVSIIILLAICACISILATASRQTFAFARDDGLPFSGWLAKVHPERNIPLNAIVVSFTITVLLSLINVGSTSAFNAVISLSVAALFTSYAISTSCLIIKRLRKEPLPKTRFSLGSFGLPINVLAVLWLCFSVLFSFFPVAPNPTAQSMNWSVVVYGGVVISSVGFYYAHGRKVYRGPIVLIQSK